MSPIPLSPHVLSPLSSLSCLCTLSPILCPMSYVSVPCLPSSVLCLTYLFPADRPLSPAVSIRSLSHVSLLCSIFPVPCTLSHVTCSLSPILLSPSLCPLKPQYSDKQISGYSKVQTPGIKLVWFTDIQILRYSKVMDQVSLVHRYPDTLVFRSHGSS